MGVVLHGDAACPRVLLIDDEEAIRAGLSRALAAEGLAVELARSGPDGLRRALADAYDLVILDLLMPGMDGRDVLRQLLRDRPGQAVLVLSCLAEVRFKVDCFNLGARDYLTKPFSLAELVAQASLRVSDTGSGVSAAELPHVFERFRTGGDRATRGTGLGLALVRAVADAHGGSVSVRSVPGRGSDFEIVLPLATGASELGAAPVG